MTNDVDPEFLAALPPDMQAEVLAQQRVAQAAARHAASATSADMDSASIIATFPPDLREEVGDNGKKPGLLRLYGSCVRSPRCGLLVCLCAYSRSLVADSK